MIIIPERQLILPASIKLSVKGFYRVQTVNKFSGKSRIDTGWYPNILLTAGLNQMSQIAGWMDYCHVGTNGADPLPTHTGLLGYFAGTGALKPDSEGYGAAGVAPYYGWKQKTFRFPAGSVAANLSEVGVGWTDGSSDQDTLISRAKILDPVLQTPTTITPLADELLDVSYQLRYYAPTADILGPQVTMYDTLYDTITRAANVTNGFWGQYIGSKIGHWANVAADWAAYNDTIGAVTQGPNGTSYSLGNTNQTDSAYSNNSMQQRVNCTASSAYWNASGGIRSVLFKTTAGMYQTEFSAAVGGAAIPKDSNYNVNMSWTLSWAEYVDP